MASARRWALAASAAVAAGLFAGGTAQAKPARCYTTDDGYYPCDFRGLDKAGSFRIAASGYPTYTLEIDQPGFAFGFVEIGGRSIALPGQYVRGGDDPACWSNPETNTKICAW